MKNLLWTHRAKAPEEGIDIGPLIDIVFILLIFFMVSTTFVKTYEMGIERPSASSATKSDAQAIRVTIGKQGDIYVDGQSVQPWMVQNRIRQIIVQSPKRPVLVTTDRDAPSGELIDVVDQCRLAGVKDVAVDVEKRF
ncbi:biopolymer transporter ExbD [Myxococcota bacterium]|nr:biopolymer transporter ExbD [Myxococcota bacterium]